MPTFWQKETIRDAVAMTFDQTYELNLPKAGQLGSLVLYISSVQNGYPFLSTEPKWRLIDWIDKIEIMADGSKVIKSFDGPEALAAAFYDDGHEPPGLWRSYSNTPHRQWIPIHFGRKLMDELYGLDLGKYDQVTLKVTNSATATQFTTDIKITVVAYWLRDAGAPFAGYFQEEVWKNWLPVAGAVEYASLPVGLPIRRILLEARPPVNTADCKNGTTMLELMADILFTFKSGQTRVFKGSLEALGHLSTLELGRFVETRGGIDKTAGYGFEVGIGYVMNGLGAWVTDDDDIATVLGNMRQDVQNSAQEVGYRTPNGSLSWVCRGFGYQHTVPLYVARKSDLEDLLDPEAEGAVKVDITTTTEETLTGTSRNARNAIILNRLVR